MIGRMGLRAAPMRGFARCLALLVLAATLTAGAVPAHAQNAIKILVNNEPITTYDIRNRAQLLKLTTGGKAGQQQAIEELIGERLKMQEAKRRGVTVSEREVSGAFATIAQRTKLTPANLEKALRQSGVDPATLKDRIRAELAWSEIVRARFRATVRVSEREVADALSKKAGTDVKAEQAIFSFELQPVVSVVPAKADKATEARALSQANAFRNQFTGCDNSLAVAKNLRGVVVKPKVLRDESQLGGDMGEEIAATEVGKATKPQRTDEGFQVVGICAKKTIQGHTKAAEDVRDELQNQRGEMMARQYLRDLRSISVIEYR
ncbi:SurA N-terminal domain-containing protein [Propylenella binzhouense]|uniref:Peptidylprolyl isomerase n=1 Tax=Propylenella binzhouense TaxID=2555902 RepID=A0A964WVI2_9HYPH|nr:SurA N-terminal domain-containing protein [Propylenella binzhouense]MYZ49850.1 peptidylprolyl isomerase [Propylenella binzhouense]